jgi:hypothetical protein
LKLTFGRKEVPGWGQIKICPFEIPASLFYIHVSAAIFLLPKAIHVNLNAAIDLGSDVLGTYGYIIELESK